MKWLNLGGEVAQLGGEVAQWRRLGGSMVAHLTANQ